MTSLADLPELVGFFSYSREDDEGSGGELSALRGRIQHELRAQLGRTFRTFRLWQDKEAIAAGTLWNEEIKVAVGQSVFFIPIITPTVVNSPYCKVELESFLARERELGRSDLVFPILYIRVPSLDDAAAAQRDPVLSVIAQRQYVDWRDARHRDINSTEIKVRVEQFCESIVRALQLPWLSPDERRQREADEARAQAERARLEEVERQEAEAQRRAREAAEARRWAEEQQRRTAEVEQLAREAEARQRADAAARSRQEADAERQAREDVEARRRAEEEQRRTAEVERLAREAEARQRADAAARSRQEADEQKRADEEPRRREEDARSRPDEEARRHQPASPDMPASRHGLMEFVTAIKSGWKKATNFSGRASRSEYWFWMLFCLIVYLVAAALDGAVFRGKRDAILFVLIAVLAVLLPTLAIAVRRLHDLDYRGWWVLIAVIPYLGPAVMAVGFCLKGTPGANRFGPDPLEIGDVASHAT